MSVRIVSTTESLLGAKTPCKLHLGRATRNLPALSQPVELHMRPLAPSLLLCLLAVSTAAADARSDFWAWYEPLVPGLHAALTGVRLHVTRYEGGEGVDHPTSGSTWSSTT